LEDLNADFGKSMHIEKIFSIEETHEITGVFFAGEKPRDLKG